MGLAAVMAQYPGWGSVVNPQVPRPDPNDPIAVQNALMRVAIDGSVIAITARPQWDNPAGLMSWNVGIDYRDFYNHASPIDKQTVRDLYIKAGLDPELDVQADLDRINAFPGILATQNAVNYWRQRTHTGIIGVPMLQAHDIGDARTPASNVSGYEDSVKKAGKSPLYRKAFIDVPGHCTFNNAEMVSLVETMVRRIETGRWANITSPENLNALGRTFGLGEPRFIDPGVAAGWLMPNTFNRAFYPDSAGPPGP
jgi:hypothetical protein